MAKDIEEIEEKVQEILKYAITGLNKDSIAAILLLDREIDVNESMINSLLSGKIWAENTGKNLDMDLDSFAFHLTEEYPRDEKEIYRYQESDEDRNIKFENLEYKLPCLLCLQNFLEAGMTDDDAIELFNRYFPEAEIDEDDCNFIRQRSHQKLDKETEKELEEKSREIVEIMKKSWKKTK